MTFKRILTGFLLPLLLFFAILFLFFKGISPGDIKQNFFRIPGIYLILFVFLTLLGTLIRAYKYHLLLGKKLLFKDMFFITLVRNFTVDLLPGRAAALLFYSWLTKKRGISWEVGASSFVISVFYDALALAFMLGGLSFFLDFDFSPWPIYIGMMVIISISIGMIFFADVFSGMFLKRDGFKRFGKLYHIVANVHEYLCLHKKSSQRFNLFLLSLGTRVVKYLFVYILFEGVVHLGIGIQQFSVFSFGLAGTEMSSLIPIQGPAGFGTWELAFAVIFETLRVPAENIKEAGFVIHIVTQVWEYFIGLAALAWLILTKPRNVSQS